MKTRVDGYSQPGTKSAWQFKRGHRQTGKRQVRVVYRTWYLDPNTFSPTWVTGPWKRIDPGETLIVKGPLVFGCYYRDGHIGAQMVGQVRKKVHGHWSAPRDLSTWTASFIFNC